MNSMNLTTGPGSQAITFSTMQFESPTEDDSKSHSAESNQAYYPSTPFTASALQSSLSNHSDSDAYTDTDTDSDTENTVGVVYGRLSFSELVVNPKYEQRYLKATNLNYLDGEGRTKCDVMIDTLSKEHERAEMRRKISSAFTNICRVVEKELRDYVSSQKLRQHDYKISYDKLIELQKLSFYVEATSTAYGLHFQWQENLLQKLKQAHADYGKQPDNFNLQEICKWTYEKQCQASASLSATINALNYRDKANKGLFAYNRVIGPAQAAAHQYKLVEFQSKKKELDKAINAYIKIEPYRFSELHMD